MDQNWSQGLSSSAVSLCRLLLLQDGLPGQAMALPRLLCMWLLVAGTHGKLSLEWREC